jgi:hypothetical protein
LHRKGLDWLMSMMGLRPMGCLTCGKRFYTRYTVVKAHLQDEAEDVHSHKGSNKAA